jgi:branched-chain amino acid transport system substrate-binding protein
MLAGVKAALATINAQGGVLGCDHVNLVTQDDAADPGDAVPAAQHEIASGIVAFVGPTSATAAVVLPLAERANIPDIMFGGGSEFDKITDPRFYRMSASDSEQAVAMVYYAKSKGWTRIALAFGNQNVDQPLVPSVVLAAQKLGMTVTANVTFTSGSTSFRSELQNLFAGSPQAIVGQVDINSAPTVFSEISQQGLSSTPWVVSNSWQDPAFVKAVGPAVASGPIYIANPGSGGSVGYAPFAQIMKQQDPKLAVPNIQAQTMYDAVNLWALGVAEARTWTEPALAAGIAKATGSGKECGTYAECYSLIKQGQAIDLEGAETALDFDKYHNVYGPFDVLQWNRDGSSTTTLVTLNAQQLQAAIGG